jgi:MarR family transcriptional regulator, organic hydroperoxide resistance regulator
MPLSKKQCIQLNQSVFSLANAYRSQMTREGLSEKTGLSFPDRSTLMILGQFEPVAARNLSKLMDINPGTISVHVQELVELGLAERSQDESDRRTWWLSLTEAGKETYQDTIDRATGYTRSFLEPLNAEEQCVLHGLTLRVAEGLGYTW